MNTAPIFIVGCPRSGTTLLRDLLRAHPRLTFPLESHFIPAFYRGYGHPRNAAEAVALAGRILKLEWIENWQLPVTAAEFADDRSFQAVLDRLYGAWAQRENKARWGDKTPHYVREIPLLRELYPDGRMIHLIRDGRDVALSWLQARMEPRNLFEAAKRWQRYVRAGRAGAGCLEVRYESLLGQTETTLRTICEYIGEPFTPAVLERNALPRLLHQPWLGRPREAKLVGPRVEPGNVAKWKTAMSRAERALFEGVAGELLQELGYEVEGGGRTPSAVEAWWWRTHHRAMWMAARLNRRGLSRSLRTEWELRQARRRGR